MIAFDCILNANGKCKETGKPCKGWHRCALEKYGAPCYRCAAYKSNSETCKACKHHDFVKKHPAK